MKATERAQQFWQYLIEQAAQRRTPSYTEAAEAIGYRGPRALGAGQYGVITRVYEYCKRNQLPILTAIVVYSDGRPNEQYENWPAERDEVFAYDWSKVPVPPETEFAL
jgi:hypothetical protein